jgi:lipopolysaccharide/colanic/teichoic acid biosynthesis glycosyltransferase
MEAERIASIDYWPDNEPEEDSGWVTQGSAVLVDVATRMPGAESVNFPGLPNQTGYVRAGKRIFDLVLGVPLFLAAMPIILAAAVAVGVTTGWPVFYKTRRVGAHGKEFTMWKIRSMVKDADQVIANWRTSHPELAAEYSANFKLRDDPRVTLVGRLIRRTSIDELPQFWNVLRGDMSLVGPRPYYDWELAQHPGTLETITQVRPGVTGPWQVAGRNLLSPVERMFLDRTYVNTCCIATDLRLLLSTVRTLLRPNGV